MSRNLPDWIVDLSTPASIAGLGKKAANLAELAAAVEGARTPRGFALPGATLAPFIHGYRREISSILRSGLSSSRTHREIEALMAAAAPPLVDGLVELLDDRFDAGTLFAVRSSAHPVVGGVQIAEDSEEHSLAGQYSSFLRVPREHVPQAVARCCASLFNARSIEIFDVANDESYLDSTMTVLVQEMVEASVSGVMMTLDPIAAADGTNVLGIEAAYGACEAIVAGKTQGDLMLVDRASRAVVERQIGSKRWRVELPVYSGSDAGESLVPVPDSLRSVFALSPDEVAAIAELGLRIESHFGPPQDIEFVLDARRNVVITQARPITTLTKENSQ
ncbi:PEP/pyruvate-binding domain-containing protein [Rhodococcus pyridinivorans]|uniref:PEP/pyruvate-binding domain-containing protein n=1 Tax=Rhodococcus pyridinivorans TaxID=103816 RepID=UPI001E4C98EE|nr:PEP/pyruvate-binding domain-containing protein [Rhodococcus pyridinivorans]MCD5422751.1 PEP/pyruvate-binding domain-containing protein [Rhodococcus pyridinivorans]